MNANTGKFSQGMYVKKFYNSKWVKWAIKQIFLIPLIVVFNSVPIHKHKLLKLPPHLSNIL